MALSLVCTPCRWICYAGTCLSEVNVIARIIKLIFWAREMKILIKMHGINTFKLDNLYSDILLYHWNGNKIEMARFYGVLIY